MAGTKYLRVTGYHPGLEQAITELASEKEAFLKCFLAGYLELVVRFLQFAQYMLKDERHGVRPVACAECYGGYDVPWVSEN